MIDLDAIREQARTDEEHRVLFEGSANAFDDITELCNEVERLRKALTEIAFDTENRKREIAVKALES